MLSQRQIEQHARAGARLAIDEAHVVAREIAQAVDALRIALRRGRAPACAA